MNGLGRHLLLELRGADPEWLNNIRKIKKILLQAAKEAGATVIGCSFRKFSPQGVSGVVMIAESHFAIHTWPEYGYAAVDIFTCGNSLKPEKAVSIIVEAADCKNPIVMEVKRGILSYKNIKYPHKNYEKVTKRSTNIL